jgi:hypothetical protein
MSLDEVLLKPMFQSVYNEYRETGQNDSGVTSGAMPEDFGELIAFQRKRRQRSNAITRSESLLRGHVQRGSFLSCAESAATASPLLSESCKLRRTGGPEPSFDEQDMATESTTLLCGSTRQTDRSEIDADFNPLFAATGTLRKKPPRSLAIIVEERDSQSGSEAVSNCTTDIDEDLNEGSKITTFLRQSFSHLFSDNKRADGRSSEAGSDSRTATNGVYRSFSLNGKNIRWGWFRGDRDGEANWKREKRLIEKMVAQRHYAQRLGDIDLASYRDVVEFCTMAGDVTQVNMSLLMARNIEKLDRDALVKSKEPKYIDVWVPDDTDGVLFLMAYSLSTSDIWKRCTVLRVVSVCIRKEDIPNEVSRIGRLLKQHRMRGIPYAVSVEEEAKRRGLANPEDIEELLNTDDGRSSVINHLIRRETALNRHRTALVFLRIRPFRSSQTGEHLAADAEDWFRNLRLLTESLPPTLLVASEKIRKSDW